MSHTKIWEKRKPQSQSAEAPRLIQLGGIRGTVKIEGKWLQWVGDVGRGKHKKINVDLSHGKKCTFCLIIKKSDIAKIKPSRSVKQYLVSVYHAYKSSSWTESFQSQDS